MLSRQHNGYSKWAGEKGDYAVIKAAQPRTPEGSGQSNHHYH